MLGQLAYGWKLYIEATVEIPQINPSNLLPSRLLRVLYARELTRIYKARLAEHNKFLQAVFGGQSR